MKYLLAGASGFLGTALRVRLAEQGHEVVRLVRTDPIAGTEFRWHPAAGTVDERAFAGVLAGSEAELAVGRDDDHDAVPLGGRARHGARGQQGLVVGVGVEGHEGVGHHRPSCRMAGSCL